jgi:hypothetical protein
MFVVAQILGNANASSDTEPMCGNVNYFGEVLQKSYSNSNSGSQAHTQEKRQKTIFTAKKKSKGQNTITEIENYESLKNIDIDQFNDELQHLLDAQKEKAEAEQLVADEEDPIYLSNEQEYDALMEAFNEVSKVAQNDPYLKGEKYEDESSLDDYEDFAYKYNDKVEVEEKRTINEDIDDDIEDIIVDPLYDYDFSSEDKIVEEEDVEEVVLNSDPAFRDKDTIEEELNSRTTEEIENENDPRYNFDNAHLQDGLEELAFIEDYADVERNINMLRKDIYGDIEDDLLEKYDNSGLSESENVVPVY